MKFSCLEQLNDLTEGLTSDVGQFGKYVFVSCWTETSEENIPLWNMYTPNMSGVRIRLPMHPFKRYGLVEIKGTRTAGRFQNSIVPKEEIIGKDYLVFPTSFQSHKIIYTDDERLLPKISDVTGDGKISINLKLLGKYKSTAWSFEAEWRYLLWIFPSAPFNFADRNYDDQMVNELRQVLIKKVLQFTSYFLTIRDEAFEQMEVVLGPKHTEGDVIMIQALLGTYNPKAIFKLSTLKIK